MYKELLNNMEGVFMAKIIYKRVVANSYDEAMNYVRNGYAFWLIDCSKIDNFKTFLDNLVYGKTYKEHTLTCRYSATSATILSRRFW